MSPTPFQLVDPNRRVPVGPGILADRRIPTALHDHRRAASLFAPDPLLVTAVNVALSIGAPLLVTGEPGTGKTQIAWWLAWYFGLLPEDEDTLGAPHVLNVKSTTVSTDLLYQFDTVAYFHAGQDPVRRGELLDPKQFRTKGPLWRAFEEIGEGRPSIVLIDEIDKAPRDFPNDLLHELDQFGFEVRETRERVRPRKGAPPPLVIITSNSERRLPDPFLRRCVVHHITYTEELLRRAVETHRGETPHLDDGVRAAAVRIVDAVRRVTGLRHKPATAELLMWLAALDALRVTAAALGPEVPLKELPALSALIKDRGDLETLER